MLSSQSMPVRVGLASKLKPRSDDATITRWRGLLPIHQKMLLKLHRNDARFTTIVLCSNPHLLVQCQLTNGTELPTLVKFGSLEQIEQDVKFWHSPSSQSFKTGVKVISYVSHGDVACMQCQLQFSLWALPSNSLPCERVQTYSAVHREAAKGGAFEIPLAVIHELFGSIVYGSLCRDSTRSKVGDDEKDNYWIHYSLSEHFAKVMGPKLNNHGTDSLHSLEYLASNSTSLSPDEALSQLSPLQKLQKLQKFVNTMETSYAKLDDKPGYVGLGLGNLTGSSVIVDSEQFVWLFCGASTKRMLPVLTDLAAFMGEILFRHTPLKSEADLQLACGVGDALLGTPTMKHPLLVMKEELGIAGHSALCMAWHTCSLLLRYCQEFAKDDERMTLLLFGVLRCRYSREHLL